MAKVAVPGPSSTNSLHFGGGASNVTIAARRKTPSELRGEQLKRRKVGELVDESPAPLTGSLKNNSEAISGMKKPDLLRIPRYIDTHVDEVFPVRKTSIRLRILSRKEDDKQKNILVEQNIGMKNISSPIDFAAKIQQQISCPEDSFASTVVAKDGTAPAFKSTDKCTEKKFCGPKELSLGCEKLPGLGTVHLDNAFKGLVAHEPPKVTTLHADFPERSGDLTSVNFCSEFHITGRRTPLDFTLKTTMRVVSSSSMNWFHRLLMSDTLGMDQLMSQFGCSGGQNICCSSELTSTSQSHNSTALYSWVYPQSSLPSSVISALTLSAAEGANDNWHGRTHFGAFTTSFVRMPATCFRFVVLFSATDDPMETKLSCNAYISQSTRGLRSLLREHDICFSMPLCHSKVMQVTKEDLVELSEIEKQNLGQIRCLASMSDVDDCPQCLLAFSGNENVHGLYDILLNYRFFLTSLSGGDVPILYSPVPFQNAALYAPEVRCKKVRKANHISFPLKEFDVKEECNQDSSADFFYSVEIKDAYLPPWIICSVCEAMGSKATTFEASFVTEPTSIGLNVGLEIVCQKSNPQATAVEGLQESSHAFGIRNAIQSPHLRSAFLKGLKYCNGSYTASLSPV